MSMYYIICGKLRTKDFTVKGKSKTILEGNREYPYDLEEKKDPLRKTQSYHKGRKEATFDYTKMWAFCSSKDTIKST